MSSATTADFAQVAANGPPLQVKLGAVPGWRGITIDRYAGTVRVPAGVTLDLGATAKAWCADVAASAAAWAARSGVLVSLGGDIAVAGQPPAGGWRIRVTDHHGAGDNAPGQTVAISGGGLATSGTTARRWRRGGQDLHHIIDPATGTSTTGPWRTVSVTARTCVTPTSRQPQQSSWVKGPWPGSKGSGWRPGWWTWPAR